MIEKKVPFFKIKKIYLNFLKKQEKGKDIFYDKLGQLKNFYIPICYSIYKWHLIKKKVLVIGLSGGQGSGKLIWNNSLGGNANPNSSNGPHPGGNGFLWIWES